MSVIKLKFKSWYLYCEAITFQLSDSEDDLEYSPFEHNYKSARIPELVDLSDDEDRSSGISSDNSLENVIRGNKP